MNEKPVENIDTLNFEIGKKLLTETRLLEEINAITSKKILHLLKEEADFIKKVHASTISSNDFDDKVNEILVEPSTTLSVKVERFLKYIKPYSFDSVTSLQPNNSKERNVRMSMIEVFADLCPLVEKQLTNAEQIIDCLGKIDLEQTSIEKLRQFVFLTLKLESGEDGFTDKISYYDFLAVESKTWWNTAASFLKDANHDFLKQWNLNKAMALDGLAAESIGRTKFFGRINDFFGLENTLKEKGKSEIEKTLKHMGVLTQTLRTTQGSREHSHAVVYGQLLEDQRSGAYSYGDNVSRLRSLKTLEELKPKIASLVLSDDSLTPTQKIVQWCVCMEQQGQKIPREINRIRTRIEQVATNSDRAADLKKDLILVNILYLLSVFGPTAADIVSAASESVEHFFHNQEQMIIQKGLMWLTTTEMGAQFLELFEHQTLNLISKLPSEALIDIFTDPQFIQMINADLSDPESAKKLFEFAITVLTEKERDFDDQLREQIELFPEEKQTALYELLEKENLNYQTIDVLLTNAFSTYETMARKYNHDPSPVFWQVHPDYVGLDDVVTDYTLSKNNNSDPLFLSITSESLQQVYHLSSSNFSNFHDVCVLYNSLHPTVKQLNIEQITLYFSDYQNFIFQQYEHTQNQVPISDILAFALVKNDGDLYSSMWDVTIALKLITRNNPFIGTPIGSLNNSDSGFLAQTMIEDPFSKGFTAADLALLLPESKYWDIPSKDFLMKNFDPANLAGGMYHIMNLLAIAGVSPTSASIGGLLQDYIGIYQGYSGDPYGSKKLRDQLDYLMSNLAVFDEIIDDLPGAPKPETKSGEIGSQLRFIAVDTNANWYGFDPRLPQEFISGEVVEFDDNVLYRELLQKLITGEVVEFEDNTGNVIYVKLGGSLFNRFILLSPNLSDLTVPVSPDAIRDLDKLDTEYLDKFMVIDPMAKQLILFTLFRTEFLQKLYLADESDPYFTLCKEYFGQLNQDQINKIFRGIYDDYGYTTLANIVSNFDQIDAFMNSGETFMIKDYLNVLSGIKDLHGEHYVFDIVNSTGLPNNFFASIASEKQFEYLFLILPTYRKELILSNPILLNSGEMRDARIFIREVTQNPTFFYEFIESYKSKSDQWQQIISPSEIINLLKSYQSNATSFMKEQIDKYIEALN